MTFAEAEGYLRRTLDEVHSVGALDGLARMRALLDRLGNPHKRYPTVHVGGTSGKGSTSTLIAAALIAAGHRCGLHTKPHITSITERMMVDNVPIPERRFADLLHRVIPELQIVAKQFGHPTYYETTLALAFLYFAVEQADIAVIEVGIGGRLDGTNVIEPLVSVITNVGLDHTEILGNTVEEIAQEKAGIAKNGVPLISGTSEPCAREVIERMCRLVGAPFYAVGERAAVWSNPNCQNACVIATERNRYELQIGMRGRFQKQNAATAICALESLPAPFRPDAAAIARAFESASIPGRMEVIPGQPTVLFDIAHNRDKVKALCDAAVEDFPNAAFSVLLAVGASKDAAGMLEELHRIAPTVTITSFDVYGRASIDRQKLAAIARRNGLAATVVKDPRDAFRRARALAGPCDVVIVTGSTYLVATLRNEMMAVAGRA